MASWFKLAPDPPTPTSGIPFDILANALAERRRRQQELEDGQLKHDRQMEFGRLQMGLTPEQQALARAKEERERARAERDAAAKSWDDNFRAQQGVIPKINEALRAGDIALAKSLAASAGITDFSELGGPQQTEPGTFDYESERFLDQMPLDGQRQLDPEQAAAEQAKADRKRVQFSLIGPSPDAPRTQTDMDIPDQSSIEQAMGVLNEYASGAQGPELAAIAKANIGLVQAGNMKPDDALRRMEDAALRLRQQDISVENSKRAAAAARANTKDRLEAGKDKGDATTNRQLRDQLATRDTTMRQLDVLDQLSQGGVSNSIETAQKREAARAILLGVIKEAETLGALDAGVGTFVDKMLGNVVERQLGVAGPRLQEVRKYLENKFDNKISRLSQPIEQVRAEAALIGSPLERAKAERQKAKKRASLEDEAAAFADSVE